MFYFSDELSIFLASLSTDFVVVVIRASIKHLSSKTTTHQKIARKIRQRKQGKSCKRHDHKGMKMIKHLHSFSQGIKG
jgi:hypothetical protein